MSRLPDVTRRVASLRRDYRSRVLLLVACGWGVSIGVRLVYPALLPYIREYYAVDMTTAGLLVSVLWVAYALGQLPGGLLADRFGERAVLGWSLVLSAGFLSLVILAPSIRLVFVATGLFGVVAALYAVPRVTILAELYPERVGSAIGVSMAAGDVGNTAFPPIAGAVAAAVVWQLGFGVWIPLLLAVGAVVWLIVPAIDAPRRSSVVSVRTVRALGAELRRPVILQLLGIVILTEITWHAFTAFYPTYLVEIKGIRPTVAAGVFGLFFAVGSVVKLLAGGAYDRVGIRSSLPLLLAVAGVGLLSLPFLDGFWLIVGCTVLISSFLGSYTVTLAYLTTTLTDEIRGTGLGSLRTIYLSLGAASPIAVGTMADRGLFDEAFWAIAGILALAIVLTTTLPRSRPEQ